jgi:hypothetical protein
MPIIQLILCARSRILKSSRFYIMTRKNGFTKGVAYNEALGETIELENSIGQAEMELLDLELELIEIST